MLRSIIWLSYEYVLFLVDRNALFYSRNIEICYFWRRHDEKQAEGEIT